MGLKWEDQVKFSQCGAMLSVSSLNSGRKGLKGKVGDMGGLREVLCLDMRTGCCEVVAFLI